jgi:hypothetical protein
MAAQVVYKKAVQPYNGLQAQFGALSLQSNIVSNVPKKVPQQVVQKMQSPQQPAPKITQKVTVAQKQVAVSVDEHKDPLPQKAVVQVKANQPMTFAQRKAGLIQSKVNRIMQTLNKLLDDDGDYCKNIKASTGRYPKGGITFRTPYQDEHGTWLAITYRVEDLLNAYTKKAPSNGYVIESPKVQRCYKALLEKVTYEYRTRIVEDKKSGALFSLMSIEGYDKNSDKVVGDKLVDDPSQSKIIQSLTVEEAENTNQQLLDYFFSK